MKSLDYIQVYPVKSRELRSEINSHPITPSSFSDDFRRLHNSDELCDVYFLVGDHKIPAHKQILAARCRKFSGMFQNGMKESRQNEIKVGCTDSKLFLALLEYIYADTVELSTPDMAMQLMILADEYLLPRLKQICEHEIIKAVDISNVAEIMESANRFNADLLKHHCLDFVIQNYDEVSSASDFKNHLRSPELMHEVIQAMGEKLPEHSKKRKRSSTDLNSVAVKQVTI